MSNLKTTLAGLITGIPSVIDGIVKASEAHALGNNWFQIAVGIGVILIGWFSKDAKAYTIAFQNPIVKTLVPVADEIVNLESKEDPNSQTLLQLKELLDKLNGPAVNTTVAPIPDPAKETPAPQVQNTIVNA